MSFSSDIKKEISKTPVDDIQQASAILYACIASIGIMNLSHNGVQLMLTYEGLSSTKFISEILEKFFKVKCGITFTRDNLNNRKSYRLTIDGKESIYRLLAQLGFPEGSIFLQETPPSKYWKENNLAASFIRGLFLSCGTITHPQKNYHAEFIFSNEKLAENMQSILINNKLSVKKITRNSFYVVYLNGGDNIALLLNKLSAYSELLVFENIRAMRDMRNNINRAANCETANFTKTYQAAKEQINAINIIDSIIGINALSQGLSDCACLRLANPELSLNELAELSGLSKSALNHRMRKIKEISIRLQED